MCDGCTERRKLMMKDGGRLLGWSIFRQCQQWEVNCCSSLSPSQFCPPVDCAARRSLSPNQTTLPERCSKHSGQNYLSCIRGSCLATEEPRAQDCFVAHVHGCWLWDCKIGWVLPSGRSLLLLAPPSAEGVNNSLFSQVLAWAKVHLCECQDWSWSRPCRDVLGLSSPPPPHGAGLLLSPLAPKRCSLPYILQWCLDLPWRYLLVLIHPVFLVLVRKSLFLLLTSLASGAHGFKLLDLRIGSCLFCAATFPSAWCAVGIL